MIPDDSSSSKTITGHQEVVIDARKRISHLHDWTAAPNPNGNRAERRAAEKKRKRDSEREGPAK